jgi:hypothetical protein
VAKLPTDERAPFVATFVGERVEIIAKSRAGDPVAVVGGAVAVAADYGRGGHVLVLHTDAGRVLAFSIAIVRNIERAATTGQES